MRKIFIKSEINRKSYL